MRSLVLMLLALSMPVAAQGFDIEASLEIGGQVRFQGTVEANVTSGGLLYHHLVEQGEPTLSIHVEGQVRLVDFPLLVARTSRDHPVSNERLREALPAQEILNETFHGTLRLLDVEKQAMHSLLPPPGGDVEHTLHGPVDARIAAPRDPSLSVYDFMQPRPETGHEYVSSQPQGRYGRLSLTQWDTPVEGASLAFLHGGRIELAQDATRTYWTGARMEREATDPVGLHEVEVLHRYVMIVEGNLSAEVGGSGWRSALRATQGQWAGDFEFSKVTSDSTIHGSELEDEMALLQVIGDVTARADYVQAPSWLLGGRATFVGVDGNTVAGSRDGSLVAVAVGMGALALLWALATGVGRHALLVAGRQVARPLGHRTRVLLMRTVSLHPGLTAGEVASRHGLHRSSVRHHLRILAAAGYVSSLKVGKHRGYAPKGCKAVKVRVWSHPVRQAMLKLLRYGEASYPEMVATWRRQGGEVPPPDAVSYHGRQLEKAGFLCRARKGRTVLWRLHVDPLDVAWRERQAYIAREGLVDVYQAMQEVESGTVEQVHATLAKRGRRLALPKLRQSLRHLYAAGFLDQEEAVYTWVGHDQASPVGAGWGSSEASHA